VNEKDAKADYIEIGKARTVLIECGVVMLNKSVRNLVNVCHFDWIVRFFGAGSGIMCGV
jgi:hypothetical protein